MQGTNHNKNEPVVENKNSLTYPSRTLDPPITIVDQAKEIEKATDRIKTDINSKLDMIVKQIKFLQDEARKIINDAYDNIELHKIPCNFQKIPGEVIYLYDKGGEALYFSRLSPEDWNNNPPHIYKGTYKLKADKLFEKIQ